ncbi:uncharacterized protein J7T54_002140 [Emericellopsis cladophorae]|uniref:Uncharacterized protein n=1 Tax=Emericellopsis cladophorae TaxID=2686198 RepID=A0A9P9Y3R4_9HYPO|nr:uncharacterized protein J7T54_002140 [Emericellopsis cladophorae]KAI6782979.1 hypothetical protein J7T54_002140 [Emericellopsis cladophorae]
MRRLGLLDGDNLRYAVSTCLYDYPKSGKNRQINSPCVTEYACEPLDTPVTGDELDSKNEDTWNYCEADDGSFKKSTVWTCVNCLRVEQYTYLANFMVALQAGCEQKPEKGHIASLSGSVFSNSPINITEPVVDIRTKPKGAGSNELTTGAIVGIAVGVGLFLVGGVALLFMYYRRQRQMKRNEKSSFERRDSDYGATPDPILPPGNGKMTASLRSYTPQNGYDTKGQVVTSGEYDDKLEEDCGLSKINYAFDPRSRFRGPGSALPSHEAYIPRGVAQLRPGAGGGLARSRDDSPHRGHERAHTVGSMTMQTCLNSSSGAIQAADHAAIRAPPPASRRTASVDGLPGLPPPPPGPPPAPSTSVPPPPPGSPPKGHSKTPSIGLPSLRRLRGAKQYTPPTVEDVTRDASMSISQPVMRSGSRFKDKPLQGGSVYATDGRVPNSDAANGYVEVPMRSGKSTLYGY